MNEHTMNTIGHDYKSKQDIKWDKIIKIIIFLHY